MTINDILTEIITTVGGDVDDSEGRAKMLVCLKGAIRKVPRMLRDRSLIKTSTVALTAGSDNASLPSDFMEELNIWYVSSGRRIMIDKPDTRREFHIGKDEINSGKPSLYIVSGKVIYFDRKADETINVLIEHFMHAYNVTTSDTFAGSDNLIEPIKDLCKGIYYSEYEEDASRGDTLKALAMKEIDNLEANYIAQEQGGHVADTD